MLESIEGKRGLDAFASTNLDFVLRSKGIQTIALAGFLTNCCVESTMRSAYERGYEVVTLTDCVAATSAAEHDNAIAYDYPMFSKPMTGDEFTATLSGQSSATDASRAVRSGEALIALSCRSRLTGVAAPRAACASAIVRISTSSKS